MEAQGESCDIVSFGVTGCLVSVIRCITEVLSRNNERAFCKEKVGSRKQVSTGVFLGSLMHFRYTLFIQGLSRESYIFV